MKYHTIVADPPWEYSGFATAPGDPRVRNKPISGRPMPYSGMAVEAICAVPVWDMADADCRLFLWATNRYLPSSFSVMDSWGFRYVQTVVWHKVGNPSPFGGSIAPIHAEFLLVGTIGHPERGERWRTSVVDAGVGDHSVKPECFLDLVEQVSPGPYLELFARRNRLGWDTWGNECLDHVSAPHACCG